MAEQIKQRREDAITHTARITDELLSSGQITQRAAAKIYAGLGLERPAHKNDADEHEREDFLSWMSSGFASGFSALGAALSGMFVTSAAAGDKSQTTRGGKIPDEPVTRPVVGGVDALLSFETLAATLKPLFNEYVWWFIAMVLVISGSIMGIREAWLRFEGILRPLTILFAFFTYHTLFLGLGLFLFKRSAATGRMLLILAALLIPVMFSIASSVTRQAAEAGAIATAVSLILSLLTLYPIAARVGIPYFSAVFYLPVPFAITALSSLTAAIPLLPLALIPALAASILTATGLQDNTHPSKKFILALVGIAILCFTLASFTLAPEEDLARTLRTLAVMAVLAQFAFLLGALDFARARFFTAVEIVVYAVIALLPLIAAGTFVGSMGTMLPFSFRILTYPFAIAIFLRAAMLHNAGVHPLIFLVMLFLYHTARIFTVEPAWQIFAFFIFPLVLPWFGSAFDERKQKIYLYWATAAGLMGSLWQLSSPAPHIAAAATGLLTAITIHRGAGFGRNAFHYLSPVGLMVFIGRLPLLQGVILQPFEIFAVLALLYGLGGLIFERKAKDSAPALSGVEGYPIEDLSLFCAAIALVALNGFRPTGDEILLNLMPDRVLPLRPLLWFGSIYVFLNLRALRDRTLLVSLFAHLGGLLFIFNWLKPRDFAESGFLLLLLSAGFYGATFFFRRSSTETVEKFGRVFLMKLRLPFNRGGINNVGEAAGFATLFTMLMLWLNGPSWIASPDLDRRGVMLINQIGLMLLIFAIFHFKTFSFMRLRGSLFLLFVLLVAIAFTAVINRLGRPLPIDAVGLRLLLLMPVMALMTLAMKVYGPRYGKYLKAEKQGQWYFSVPVAGVIGLTLLLFFDGLLVSTLDFDRTFYFVPPTLFLALALYPLILAHTVTIHLRHLFYFFMPVFLAAVAGERSFLGPQLSNLNAAGAWLPAAFTGNPADLLANFSLALADGYSYLAFRQNIVLGIAGGVLLLSILAFASRRTSAGTFVAQTFFSKNSAGVSTESGIWSLVFTVFIALMSFQVAAIPPGVILIGVVVFYLIAGNIRASAFILFIAGLLIVHGGAHLGQNYPLWPGPVLVVAAIFMILPAKKIAQKLDLAESFVSETAFLAGALYIVAAFFYSATEGRPANALQAGYSVLAADANYLVTGGFYRAFALPATFTLTAVFFWLALRRIEGRARVAIALLGHFAFAAALMTGVWLGLSLQGNSVNFLTAAPFVMLALLLFEVIITARLKSFKEKDADVYAGNFTARDAMILFCGLLFIPISQNLANPIPHAGIATLAALILYLVVNIQAAFTSSKTRYIYIAQATIAGIYYSARPMLNITSPQTDAFFAFGYAFALLGISIAADRFGATVVSEPTRRFAAAMPLVVGLIIDNFRSFNAALYALISSGLYLGLSRIGERNLFAALAAITLNAALFFVALAQGFDSSEFYAFPIGLTIIFFATIFKGSLSADNQARVRTIGGLVAYIPAAMHVTLRSGLAQNPVYSLVFGAICLAGIIAGGIFRIRSYLFLGVLFFTLNIVANLVQEGLQNQFIGFVLLTVTGLVLIAILIIYNLKKEQIHAGFARLRQRFSGWS
jgi:hypothetical protein